MKPDFRFEKNLWDMGFGFVAGLDEVGRGSFAGPVVSAAVVYPKTSSLKLFETFNSSVTPVINDSKKLNLSQRIKAAKWIKKNSLVWSMGVSTVAEINRLGMAKATAASFRRAVFQANARLCSKYQDIITKSKIPPSQNPLLNYLLLDAFYLPFLKGYPRGLKKTLKGSKNPTILHAKSRQLAIINGDQQSISIASASIIAKVYRDKIMVRIGKLPANRKYGWAKNKGYASKFHREAILKFGITRYHRKSFVSTFLKNHQSQ